MRFLLIALAMAGLASGAEKKHRVVLEVTAEAAQQWEAALNNVENLRKAFGAGTVDIEVVAHGKGLRLVLKSNTTSGERVRTLLGNDVVFAACENSMRKMKVSATDLIESVKPVDSGVAEVVRKQEAGWSYLKAGS